jgi:hypothetical protein
MSHKTVGILSLVMTVFLVLTACGEQSGATQPDDVMRTQRPKVCIVPDVVEKNHIAAEKLIIETGLQFALSRDFDTRVPEGFVISQDPPAASRMEPCDGEVVIVVSSGTEPQPTKTPEPTKTHLPTNTPEQSVDMSESPINTPMPPTLPSQTKIQPTSNTSPSSQPTIISFPKRFLSETGIPNDTMLKVNVEPDTIHVITSGPVCFENICLPGGENRGSVVILLPREEHYNLTHMVPTQNWHGAYYAQPDQWPPLAKERVTQMQMPGNCTDGKACSIVDVLVISEEGIVEHYTVE